MTPYGMFEKGAILTSEKYPEPFLVHLVEDCGAAEWMDYDTKIDEDYEVKKKPLSSQSLPPDKASPKRTRGRPRKKV